MAWGGDRCRRIAQSLLPVTNTVCAILYRTEFLMQLLDVWEALPMEPVVPIDWKLNRALMTLYQRGSLPPGSTWLVDPAPIIQMSMIHSRSVHT
jgi:hypothetical protein